MDIRRISWTCGLLVLTACGLVAAEKGKLSIAVAETAIEPIVIAVGGPDVDTFGLFRGCVLRKDLLVEPSARGRLAAADAIVWTGYLNESAAIRASVGELSGARSPVWIDVSKGAARTTAPVSSCYGAPDPSAVAGDPFFWLNPRNGGVIARNLALDLGVMRPSRREYYLANAASFQRLLDADIARWTRDLKTISRLRVFSTQCGWQNFSRLGGPVFAVCKDTPGVLPAPAALLVSVRRMKVQVVIVDPNTPVEYGRIFRQDPSLVVVDVPSALDNLPGARSFSGLFDNMTSALLKAAGQVRQRAQS